GLVVVRAGGGGVEGQVELVLPAELEPRVGQRVVPGLRAGVALGEVGGVGGDLVGDHALLDVFEIGQAEMLLRGDVAEHRGAVPADHGRADGRGDVVVAGGDVGGERAERVEGGIVAQLLLQVDVLLDLVHRDVSRAFDHHLDVPRPGYPAEFTEGLELGQLGAVVRVVDRAGAQAV